MSRIKGWWGVLKASRALKGPFRVDDLAKVAKVDRGVASGYLAKFVRWGYAAYFGVSPTAPAPGKKKGKWVRLYILSDRGLSRPAPRGRMVFKPGKG